MDLTERKPFLRVYSCSTFSTARVDDESVSEFASFIAHSTNSLPLPHAHKNKYDLWNINAMLALLNSSPKYKNTCIAGNNLFLLSVISF